MAAAAMAAAVAAGAPSSALSFKSSEVGGGSSSSLHVSLTSPAKARSLPPRRLNVVAKGKKLNLKEPFGPCGGTKFREGVDANGSKAKGKGVYQYSRKYGGNVDGYSPIYAEEEWATSGDVYAGGQAGLALWALTFGALLLAGALLIYNTSALV